MSTEHPFLVAAKNSNRNEPKRGRMDIWITLIEDRHADVDALPFTTEAAAIAAARDNAPDDAEPEPLNDAMRKDGWVFYMPYGSEGDHVRVIRRTVDGD